MDTGFGGTRGEVVGYLKRTALVARTVCCNHLACHCSVRHLAYLISINGSTNSTLDEAISPKLGLQTIRVKDMRFAPLHHHSCDILYPL